MTGEPVQTTNADGTLKDWRVIGINWLVQQGAVTVLLFLLVMGGGYTAIFQMPEWEKNRHEQTEKFRAEDRAREDSWRKELGGSMEKLADAFDRQGKLVEGILLNRFGSNAPQSVYPASTPAKAQN